MVSDKKSSENVSPLPQCRPALGQQDMEYIPNTQGGGALGYGMATHCQTGTRNGSVESTKYRGSQLI